MRNGHAGTTKGPRNSAELDHQVDELEPARVHLAIDRAQALTLLRTC